MTPLSVPPTPAWSPRRIAIIGAGAMGTSLAAITGKAVPTVVVCIEPDRAAQLFRDGAQITGKIEAKSRPIIVRECADLAQTGGVSAVFVATKTTAIPDVARSLRPVLDQIGDQVGVTPFVISYQNGIDPGRQLIEALGQDRVLRMVLNFGAVWDAKTGIARITMSGDQVIGCLNPEHAPACRAIAQFLTGAGLKTSFVEDLERHVWSKGIVNAAMSPVSALVNANIGDAIDSPARMIVQRLLEEGVSVASAEGLDLGSDFITKAWKMLEAAPEHLPSMVEDIRAGRESEVGQLNRQVIEHAKRLGVKVPTHEVIDALIEAFDWKVYHSHHPVQAK